MATKICKICGKEYEYCHTNRRVAGLFRWQDVACCSEHGSEYLAKIEASRSGRPIRRMVRATEEQEVPSFDDIFDDVEDEAEDVSFMLDDADDDDETID